MLDRSTAESRFRFRHLPCLRRITGQAFIVRRAACLLLEQRHAALRPKSTGRGGIWRNICFLGCVGHFWTFLPLHGRTGGSNIDTRVKKTVKACGPVEPVLEELAIETLEEEALHRLAQHQSAFFCVRSPVPQAPTCAIVFMGTPVLSEVATPQSSRQRSGLLARISRLAH
jgi:hypothetical protein